MKNIPRALRTLLFIYLMLITLGTIFRVLLCFFNLHLVETIPANDSFDLLKRAFTLGWQFDTVIASYLLLIPYILLMLNEWIDTRSRLLIVSSEVVLQISSITLLIIYCVDIPYFNYFGSRITNAVFQWMNTPAIVLEMLIHDTNFLIFILLFLVLAFLTSYAIRFIFSYHYKTSGKKNVAVSVKAKLIYTLIALVLLFFGAKGTVAGATLRLSDAIFCKYPFPNQLSNNAAFSLIRNMLDKVNFMDDEIAKSNIQRLLNIEKPIKDNPFAREIKPDSAMKKMNVVVVLMESMTAKNLDYFGNKQHLTPNLDSLLQRSISFDNAYSAGIHTNNGIFSTLFAYPSSWRERPMSATKISNFTGFSGVLKHFGYKNYYFTTHDKGFDNASVFIPKNSFDTIISQTNYPIEEVVGPFGVPDHVEYNKAIEVFNKNPATQPFLATILSTSNHPPIVIPQNVGFIQRSADESDAVIEYADWAIGDFMRKAAQEPWFKSTIFIFLADHGANKYDSKYDLILNYNHIPCFIYSPALIPNPKHILHPCGQIDIMPTVMGLMNAHYINNTPGIDVIKQNRPYTFFSADDKLGCIDEEFVFVYRKNKTESLYKYRSSDVVDYKNEYKAKVDSMKNYAFSMMQASQWAIINDKVGWLEK